MKVSLAINSIGPDTEQFGELLWSAKDFDEIRIVIDKSTDIVEGFNRAVSSCTGDWICSFADDDYFLREETGQLIEQIKAGAFDNADVIHFQVGVNDPRQPWGSKDVTFGSLMASNQIPHGSFFRKSLWEKVGGYQLEPCTDWDFWLRCAAAGARFEYFPGIVYVFRKGHKETAYDRQLAKYGGMGSIKKLVHQNVERFKQCQT